MRHVGATLKVNLENPFFYTGFYTNGLFFVKKHGTGRDVVRLSKPLEPSFYAACETLCDNMKHAENQPFTIMSPLL